MIIGLRAQPTFFRAIKLGISFLPIAILVAVFEFSLPLILESQELDVIFIGTFISFSWLATTFLDIWWGRIIDRYNKKWFITIGVALFTLCIFLFSQTQRIEYLLALTVIAYIGYDIFYISVEGFLIDISNKKYFNYGTSGFFPIWQIGFIVGPFLAATAIITWGFYEPFIYAPIFGVATVILFFLLFRTVKQPIRKNDTNVSLKSFLATLWKTEYMVLIGIFLCAFWYSVMSIGIPLMYVIEQNSVWSAALVSVSFATPFVFTDLIAGVYASNRHRRFLIITIGFLIGGVALMTFFLTTQNILLGMLCAFFSTVGINIAWASFEIEAGLISEKQKSASVEGMFVFWKNMGWDTSPFLFGLVASLWGLKMPFLLMGIGFVIMAGIFVKKHVQIK